MKLWLLRCASNREEDNKIEKQPVAYGSVRQAKAGRGTSHASDSSAQYASATLFFCFSLPSLLSFFLSIFPFFFWTEGMEDGDKVLKWVWV